MEDQKMKTVALKELGEGSIFTYGGIDWAVLDPCSSARECRPETRASMRC